VNPKYDLFDDISRWQLWGIPYLKFGYRRAISRHFKKRHFPTNPGAIPITPKVLSTDLGVLHQSTTHIVHHFIA
jgi:hypothetical protein